MFFHFSRARKVTHTDETATLTTEPDTPYVGVVHRNPIKILMAVEKTPKGWRAVSWGVLPKPPLQPLGIRLAGMLDSYVGGEVSDFHGRTHTVGKLESFTVVNDELTLIMQDATWWDGTRSSSAELYALAYDLGDARLNRRLPYGRLGLEVDNHRITFNPVRDQLANYTGD